MAPKLWSVDLHSHTLFSDGSLTPAELVRLARTNGVRALSVTDHDHVGGIDEALEAGDAVGIEIIPGIELSVTYAEFDDIHLLAYYFAWHDSHLRARLESFRLARETRAERILERINGKLLQEGHEPIAYDAVKAQVQGAFGRPHIATALIDHGYVPDMNTAFTEYLIPCNVPKYFMPAAEAIALVRQARGLSSVAHPRFITQDRVRLQEVIQELSAFGLDGVEAYHSHHDAEEQLYFIRLADQLGLMITGGSDYHGFRTKGVPADSGGKLGSLQLPYGVAVRLRQGYFHHYPTQLLLLQWPANAAAAIRRAFETHYRLSSVRCSPPAPISSILNNRRPEAASCVVDLPMADAGQVGAIAADGTRRGWRTIGLPWETASVEGPEGFYQTGRMTSERLRQTPVERLAHELVHAAILAQLQ
jgi:predicted metal-dependent phosphoesterase TrpH